MTQDPEQTRLAREVERRRTFAIISHPDAGKTTLTEKLLLFGGALREAGAVRARRAARHATSDWLELEKQRGISVSTSVMHFEHAGYRVNILDTPGHQDFSEDTYRTLMAADSAVMLIDAGKGVETQTRKLFQVCRLRHIPIFTFINKMDRLGREPLDRAELGRARNESVDACEPAAHAPRNARHVPSPATPLSLRRNRRWLEGP